MIKKIKSHLVVGFSDWVFPQNPFLQSQPVLLKDRRDAVRRERSFSWSSELNPGPQTWLQLTDALVQTPDHLICSVNGSSQFLLLLLEDDKHSVFTTQYSVVLAVFCCRCVGFLPDSSARGSCRGPPSSHVTGLFPSFCRSYFSLSDSNQRIWAADFEHHH